MPSKLSYAAHLVAIPGDTKNDTGRREEAVDEAPVTAYSIVLAIFAASALWYGSRPFVMALLLARAGIVHIPALVLGAAKLWVGGMLALAAGSLTRTPPEMPDRLLITTWTGIIMAVVLAAMISRRPEVEARLSERQRRVLSGRYIVLGALVATIVLAITGYY